MSLKMVYHNVFLSCTEIDRASYNGRPIESRILSIERRYFQ